MAPEPPAIPGAAGPPELLGLSPSFGIGQPHGSNSAFCYSAIFLKSGGLDLGIPLAGALGGGGPFVFPRGPAALGGAAGGPLGCGGGPLACGICFD
jgi:hypothetical protein